MVSASPSSRRAGRAAPDWPAWCPSGTRRTSRATTSSRRGPTTRTSGRRALPGVVPRPPQVRARRLRVLAPQAAAGGLRRHLGGRPAAPAPPTPRRSATPARALRALLRASGAVAVDGVEELVDTAALLHRAAVARRRPARRPRQRGRARDPRRRRGTAGRRRGPRARGGDPPEAGHRGRGRGVDDQPRRPRRGRGGGLLPGRPRDPAGVERRRRRPRAGCRHGGDGPRRDRRRRGRDRRSPGRRARPGGRHRRAAGAEGHSHEVRLLGAGGAGPRPRGRARAVATGEHEIPGRRRVAHGRRRRAPTAHAADRDLRP